MYSSLTHATLALASLASALNVPRQSSNNSLGYSVKTPPLTTPWTYTAGTNPWPEYPRPQLSRSQWQSLNGIWTYQNATSLDAVDSPPFGQTLGNSVLIPSCLESGLSGMLKMLNIVCRGYLKLTHFQGIQAQGIDVLYSWFSTTFDVPASFTNDRVLLNFGAVDYEATVFVNGHNATFHRGGYFAFTVDITDYLHAGDTNEL